MSFGKAIKNAIKRETNRKIFGHARPVQHQKNKLNPKRRFKMKLIRKIRKM